MYRDNESSANAVDLVAKHLNRKHQRASLSISENRRCLLPLKAATL